MDKYTETMQLIRSIRIKTDTAVLFYSAGGKDGIALLDMLAKQFRKVICYYMYLIPGLDHIKPYIKWAEQHYRNVEVRQIKHYQRDYFDRYGFFQLGEGDETVKCRRIGDVEEMVRQETGQQYVFSGMKGVDGYMKRMRLMMFKKRCGFYISDKGMVYPLAVWTNSEVLKYIENNNLIKPFTYNAKDVSQGFGIDLVTLLAMRDRFPRDYRRMIEDFPFCEKLIFDFQNGIIPTGEDKRIMQMMRQVEKQNY